MTQQTRNFFIKVIATGFVLFTLQACTGVNTYPMILRSGDTFSVMVGGSEQARKDTIDVTLQDSTNQTWDLKSLGLIRSVFNVRLDGRAQGLHYSPFLDSDVSWNFQHEPVQTVLVADLPTNMNPGIYSLTISLNANDNSSGIGDPYTVNLEIIPGAGNRDSLLWRNGLRSTTQTVQFGKLEPAPHAKITFPATTIYAASLKVSFNNLVLNGGDINVYTPESTVRGSFMNPGPFGEHQRMVYWHQDGQHMYIDVIAPQGISSKYLYLYLIHSRGLNGSPDFALANSTFYDIDGNVIPGQTATLEYFQ